MGLSRGWVSLIICGIGGFFWLFGSYLSPKYGPALLIAILTLFAVFNAKPAKPASQNNDPKLL